jgi:hypothetical protein
MKTSKLIEEVSCTYLLSGQDSEKSKEIKDEIIEKLRQLEDMKKVVDELLDASTTIDELCCDLLDIADFQKGDINYGRKE